MNTLRRFSLASAALLCSLGSAATAQTAPPTPGATVEAAATAPVNDQAAQDRIMALVRAGKCGPAKTEATRVGDLSLADQIGTMCGARSSDPFAKGGGKGKGGGSAGSGGRRASGGSGPS